MTGCTGFEDGIAAKNAKSAKFFVVGLFLDRIDRMYRILGWI